MAQAIVNGNAPARAEENTQNKEVSALDPGTAAAAHLPAAPADPALTAAVEVVGENPQAAGAFAEGLGIAAQLPTEPAPKVPSKVAELVGMFRKLGLEYVEDHVTAAGYFSSEDFWAAVRIIRLRDEAETYAPVYELVDEEGISLDEAERRLTPKRTEPAAAAGTQPVATHAGLPIDPCAPVE